MARFRQYVPSIKQAVMPGLLRDWTAARDDGLALPAWRVAREARLHLLPSLDLLRTSVVVDLGANVGDWTGAVLEVEPDAHVIAVEPADDPRRALAARFGDDPRVRIDARAIADVAGPREFHLTAHSHNASLKPPRAEMDDHYGHGWATEEVTTVDVTTVDELTDGAEVGVLKIDVQGAELAVLRGATETLRRTRAILLEVTFVSHYEDDTGFAQLHEHMLEAGFSMVGLSEPKMSAQGVVLWCDACYART